MTSVRFIGGPFDGRDQSTTTPADEYRIIGGVYRRDYGQHSSILAEDTIMAYCWQPDETERWHTSDVEAAGME